jgi:isocitrate/isopropylmalate dehydrogenase
MPKIAVIPGDGVGPEVVREAVKVLNAVISRADLEFELMNFDFDVERSEAEWADYYHSSLKTLRENCDAVLMGPVNRDERFGRHLDRDLLRALRLDLNLFVNYFPVRLIEAKYCPLKTPSTDGFDFIILQDNLEGIHNGIGGLFKEGTDDEQVMLQTIFSRRGVRRIIRYAFESARRNGNTRITLSGHQFPASLWNDLMSDATEVLSSEFPDIAVNRLTAEQLVAALLRNPGSFEVIVVCGNFGDLLTHFASGLQGGAGISAVADVNPGKTCLVRPLHGVDLDQAGKGTANPLAAISAVALMLKHLGFEQESDWVNAAVRHALATDNVTSDLGGRLDTAQVGNFIADQIKRGAH